MSDARARLFKTVLVVLTLLAAGEIFARRHAALLRQYDARRSYLRSVKYLLYPTIPRPDLCFIGTSRTDCAFKSDWFRGITIDGIKIDHVFNFGIEYGVVNEWITSRFILRSGKIPKIAVYEVTPCAFNGNYSNPYFEYLPLRDGLRFNRLNRNPEEAWQWAVGWVDHHVLERVSKLYDYRQAVEYLAHEALYRAAGGKGKVWKQPLGRPPDGYGGGGDAYAVSRDRFAALADPSFDRIYPSCSDFRMDRGRERFFEDSVDSLTGAGARVILLDIPVSQAMERVNYSQRMRDEYGSYLAGFARERRLRFLKPARESCGLTDRDYVDMSHLGQDGGRKFSACVRKLLP